MKKDLRRKGFTLVEVMSGAAIVMLLAALATPSFIRSQIDANEAIAQSTLRTLHVAMDSYRFSNSRYPPDLSQLSSAGTAGPAYVDEKIASGSRGGYLFRIDSSTAYTYQISATPVTVGKTGERSFLLTEGGVIQDLGKTSPTGIGTLPQP